MTSMHARMRVWFERLTSRTDARAQPSIQVANEKYIREQKVRDSSDCYVRRILTAHARVGAPNRTARGAHVQIYAKGMVYDSRLLVAHAD